MAEILIEGIKYTNLSQSAPNGITGIGLKRIGNANNPVEDLESGDTASKLINAVEIDWNGATLSYVNQPGVLDASNQVNTTGQLLALMNNLQSRLSA